MQMDWRLEEADNVFEEDVLARGEDSDEPEA